jgi:hypothetical protein
VRAKPQGGCVGKTCAITESGIKVALSIYFYSSSIYYYSFKKKGAKVEERGLALFRFL